jgi:L-rhamnose mutarotase
VTKSIAWVVDLIDDPEIIAKYEEYHRNAWPEVRAKQKALGIERMEIFRSGNRLFMHMRVPDDFSPERDSRNYVGAARNKEWNDIMSSFMQKVPAAADDALWHEMLLAFDSEWLS